MDIVIWGQVSQWTKCDQTNEASIIGLQATTDEIKVYENRPELIPITKEFISLGRSARVCYKEWLEKENKEDKKSKEDRKREKEAKLVIEKEEKLHSRSKDLENAEKLHADKGLLEEMSFLVGSSPLDKLNIKLKEALKKI